MERQKKDQEKNPLISGRRLSKEESSTPVIPNWASSDDELEQGRDAILSPIFSDLDLQLDISDGTEWDQCPSPNELLNTGFHCPSDRVPSTLRFSGCGSTEEDSVGSLMKQSFSNGDQAGSCSDHSEPGSNVEDNAQEDSGHVDNDAPIPVRSYAAVTFAKPVNSDNTLTKGPSCEGAKVEEKSPMQIPQSAAGINKSEKLEPNDCYEHLPYWFSDGSDEDDFIFAPYKNSHCFEAYYGNNGSESDDCSAEALMAYNNICKYALEGNEKKYLPRDNSSEDPTNIGSITTDFDFNTDNNATSEKMPEKMNAKNSNRQIPCANHNEVNADELTHSNSEANMAYDHFTVESNEQKIVTPSDTGRICSTTDLNHSEACNGAEDEQDAVAEPYEEPEDPYEYQYFGQYSGEYAYNPYSFDYDGHPYYYGCFLTESDQDETDEEDSDHHDQEPGNKGNMTR